MLSVHMHVLFSSIIIMISMKLPCVVHLAKRWSFSSTVSVRWLSPLSSIQVDILWFNNTCIHFAWKKFLGRTYFELISRSRYKKSAIFRTHYFKFFFSVCFMLCILLFHPQWLYMCIYIYHFLLDTWNKSFEATGNRCITTIPVSI